MSNIVGFQRSKEKGMISLNTRDSLPEYGDPSLPLLLFLSLFLFLIGLADWLFQLHKGISGLIIVGVGLAFIFYASTTILAIRHVDSPFRTPVSKSIPLIYHTIIKYITQTSCPTVRFPC